MTGKQVVAGFITRSFNDRDPAGAAAVLGDDFVFHNGADVITTAAGWVRFATGWLTGFPDLNVEITFLMAEGDRVLARWVGSGTHRGEFRGVAATGRRIEAAGMTLFQVQDGRIIEMWDSPNALGQPESLRVLD